MPVLLVSTASRSAITQHLYDRCRTSAVCFGWGGCRLGAAHRALSQDLHICTRWQEHLPRPNSIFPTLTPLMPPEVLGQSVQTCSASAVRLNRAFYSPCPQIHHVDASTFHLTVHSGPPLDLERHRLIQIPTWHDRNLFPCHAA
jgi:hypothetical protein